jgi:hypothetical protein
MKIFISIASYRDPLLANTVKDAYDNAHNKDSLVFGIVDQSYGMETFDPNYFEFKKQIRYVRIEPHLARGACWARHLVQTLYNEEEYYFQIDSHTIFDKDWDLYFINQYRHLEQYHANPIITSYPYPFDIVDGDLTNLKKGQTTTDCMMLAVNEEHTFKNKQEQHASIRGTFVKKKEPSHGFLVAGGCLFGPGHLVERVPYDPHIYFSGEECSYALRLWTHGYNIFHPCNMPVYHQYVGKYRNKAWADKMIEPHAQTKWHEYSNAGKSRSWRVTTGKELGIYGLGTKRTLKQYIDFCGLDYINQKYTDKKVSELNYKESV